MTAKAVSLALFRTLLIMVIEPRFADCDNPRVLCQLNDLVGRDVEFLVGIMRVCTNRAVNRWVSL